MNDLFYSLRSVAFLELVGLVKPRVKGWPGVGLGLFRVGFGCDGGPSQGTASEKAPVPAPIRQANSDEVEIRLLGNYVPRLSLVKLLVRLT